MFTLGERTELGLRNLKEYFLQKEYFEVINNEIQNGRIKFSEILKKFNIPENNLNSEKNNNIQKTKIIIEFPDENELLEQFSAEKFLDNKYEYIKYPKGYERNYKELLTTSVSESFDFTVFRVVMKNGSDRNMLSFSILNNDDFDPNNSSEIRYEKNGNKWELVHRFLPEELQGQGLAKKILEFSEKCIEKISKKEGVKEVYTANVGQIDALYWFLRNGYIPEKSEDFKKANMVLSGDDSLKIINATPQSKEGWEDEKLENLPQKYIVKKDSEYSESEFWDDYMKKGFRINLVKK